MDSLPSEPAGKHKKARVEFPKEKGSFSGELPDPGIEPASPALQVDYTSWATWEADLIQMTIIAITVDKNPLEEME